MEIKPPRDKFDLDAVAALAGVDGATLRPLLPDLLAWLQDANWPIAAPLADVLCPHQQAFDAELAGLLDYRAGADEAARDFLARRRQPEKGF